jgi:two-component system phosphate regulon sensor histidine kinase PhoR
VKLQIRFFVMTVAVALASLAVSWGLLVSMVGTLSVGLSRREVTAAAGLGLLVALSAGFVLARTTARTFSQRLDAIVDRARRQADATSAVGRDMGDDELSRVAHAFDQAAAAMNRRVEAHSAQQTYTAAILDVMVEGVLVIDESGRVQTANPSVMSMLGVDGEPAGSHYLEWIRHPEITRMITAALRGEHMEPCDVRLNTMPPQVLLASARPLTVESQRGVALVLHDVTQQRRADNVRQDFVANVSHELRTPLTAIRGSVEALADEGLSGGAPRFLSIIERNSARMERLVSDLLRLARLDAQQEVLGLTSCSVESLFRAVRDELAPMSSAKRQQIDLSVSEAARHVQADPIKLHDALRNLVENASVYAPEDSIIELTAESDGVVDSLSVADRGPGIPDADRARVFERFYRVDAARSREKGGTGLGLSIVKHLVGLHGGTVRVAGRDGGGSVFTITLPHRR